jgi:proteic killer suppression protein
MIVSFGDKPSEDIFHGIDSKAARKIPHMIVPIITRKFDMLNAARNIQDLRSPPGNRLEALKGDLVGFFSIRINDQYRIIFQMTNDLVSQVRITDYH